MAILRLFGLLNFLILMNTSPAHPIMGEIDTTISPLSNELITTSPIQEITTDGVEHIPNTSKPHVEESDTTMTHELTTVTEEKPTPSAVLLESVTEMKSTPAIPILNPAISLMSNLFQVTSTESPSTSIVTTTTLMTPAVSLPAVSDLMMSDGNTNGVFKQPDETVSAVTTSAPVSTLPAVTTAMNFLNILDGNELFKQPDNSISVAVTEDIKTNAPAVDNSNIEVTTSHLSTLSPVSAEATLSPPSNENSFMQSHDEIDNVLSMSSNEDTTRMASSTDSKVDTSDKQVVLFQAETEPPKSQETKNEIEQPKSNSNSISASFVVLFITVLYVIV